MRKQNIIVFLAVIVLTVMSMVAFFIGCTPPRPGPDGRQLYNYITIENNDREWKIWPGKGALYQADPLHGAFLTTYVTDATFSEIQGKKGIISDGGIIVKENYTLEKKLEALTVMYKVKGYDASNNDWFWVKYAANGRIDAEGKLEGCTQCHYQQRDQG